MAELLLPIIERKADELAVDDEFGQVTWAQTNERINRLITALRALGLEVGDRVALLASNRREYAEVNTACFCSGLILVPVNWHLAAPEIEYILGDSGAKVVVADPMFVDNAVKASGPVPTKVMLSGGEASGFVSYEELLADASPDEPSDQVGGGNMFYTSGTTGSPKGVRSNALQPGAPLETLNAMLGGLRDLLKIVPEAKMFVNSPLYHAGPYAWTMLSASGGSALVLRQKFDPKQTLEDLDSNEVEQAYFVPTHFVRFLKLPDEVKSTFDASALKAVFHTGAPCPPDVKRAMIEWWGPVFVDYYGASEGPGTGTIIDSHEWLKKPGSVGKPLPTCEVRILDDKGKPLGPNEVGQIYFKSLIGTDFEYHNAPEKTEGAHLEPGVFTFGDVGYLDDDGYLFLSDRKIDMIVSGGANIYPAEIEAVLISHPSVEDVAVFGVPNDEFGEEVKAAVQLVGGAEGSDELADELRKYARERLAGYKTPRSIDFHKSFPRTALGKLQKRELRDPYWKGRERAI